MQYINSDPKKRRPYGISQIGGGGVYVPTVDNIVDDVDGVQLSDDLDNALLKDS